MLADPTDFVARTLDSNLVTLSNARSLRRVVRPIAGCLLVFASATSARAQAVDSTETSDARKPFARWSESVHSVRDSLVTIARAQVGTRYVLGGTTPIGGFDCSGLVKYVMAAFQVDAPPHRGAAGANRE